MSGLGTLCPSLCTPGLSEFFQFRHSEVFNADFAVIPEEKKDAFQKFASKVLKEAQQEDMTAAKQESSKPVQLKKDQLEYLTSTYNPRKMSETEYRAFIHDMVEMGVVTEDDTRFLSGVKESPGYGLISVFEPGGYCSMRILDTGAASYFDFGDKVPRSYADSNGDILAWYGFEAAWRTHDPSTQTYNRARRERVYGKVYDVLHQMAQNMPDSGEAARKEQVSFQRDYQASRLAWDLKFRVGAAPK